MKVTGLSKNQVCGGGLNLFSDWVNADGGRVENLGFAWYPNTLRWSNVQKHLNFPTVTFSFNWGPNWGPYGSRNWHKEPKKDIFVAHFTKWTSIKVQTCIQDDFQTNLNWVINSWTIFGALIGAPWPVQSVQLGYFWEFSLLSSELHCKIYILGAPIITVQKHKISAYTGKKIDIVSQLARILSKSILASWKKVYYYLWKYDANTDSFVM